MRGSILYEDNASFFYCNIKRYSGEVGDLIVGRISSVDSKRWKVDINAQNVFLFIMIIIINNNNNYYYYYYYLLNYYLLFGLANCFFILYISKLYKNRKYL
jgi:hypothetical protein